MRHRALLDAVVFIAVTGSCGKTTTKNLAAHVLASRYRGAKSRGSLNCGTDVAEGLLSVRSDDDYFVQELGAWGPGTLDDGIDLVRPDIGVLTNLRNDHYSAFRGALGAQTEKAKLLACLPSTGTAVLNWDDPNVRILADRTSARVLSVGRHSDADLRASDVSSRWPSPLSFRVRWHDQDIPVRTQLHGKHLLGSALAGLAIGLTMDLSLEQAVAALATAEATPRRMTSLTSTDGVTFVRDDFKAPVDSIPEVVDFLRDADATRKILVLGRISDYPGRARRPYTDVARNAMAALDAVVFVGDLAVNLWGEISSGCAADQTRIRQQLGVPADVSSGSMYVFDSVARCHAFLRDHLRAGDIVLLKGSGPADHLERIALSRTRSVRCWLHHCGRVNACDACEQLAVSAT